jgi:putative spermidine/putrescine transport system permease protein
VDEVTGRFPRVGFLVLGLGIVYVLVPLAASVKFSLWQGHAGFSISAYTDILRDPQFRHTLWFSFQLAIETTVLTMILMVPTVYWVHLRLPRLRPAVEIITVLPLVTPPIVLVVGLLDVFRGRAPVWFIDSPKFLVAAYVIICLPFVYRALDAGIRAVDIHTLTEAAQSLGASRSRTLFRVILPSLRNAVAISCLLCFVIVLGEYTIASIDLYETFPVYITFIGTSTAYQAAALSIISVILTFGVALVFVLLARAARPGGRKSRADASILRPTTSTPTIP